MVSIAGHGSKWPLPLHDSAVQRSSHARHLSKAIATAFSIVAVWLVLRYIVDVEVTVRWRKAGVQEQHQGSNVHCTNTCYKARDGVCDEGRPHKQASKHHHHQQQQAAQGMPAGVSAVHCDLGTDCSDCGPWLGRQADVSWSRSQLPIAFLRSHKVSVRARQTSEASNPLNLSIAFTDPALDWDVSKYIQKEGVLEVGISQVFHSLLADRCGANGPGGLVVDVGANFGWYTLLAAQLGCRVIAWEPVPQFLALLSHNLARNHLSHRVTVRPTVVAHPAGSKQVVVIPGRGIWGTAGIAGLNIDTAAAGSDGLQQVEVVAEALDDVLSGLQVDLMKVDVEGYEPSVLATAAGLLSAGSLSNIILEYSPGMYERANRWSELWVFPKMLLDLSAAGYELMHLTEDFTRVWSDGRRITAALPQFKQILPENLRYDLWDVQASDAGYLNYDKAKAFCQAMIDLRFDSQGVPERLHPKSFHSVFMHNTNVWASRERKVCEPLLGAPVGLFPLSTPVSSSWFPPSEVAEGLGGVTCAELAEDMVRQMRVQDSTGANNNSGGGSSSSNSSDGGGGDGGSSSWGRRMSADEVNMLMTILIGRRCRCSHQLPCSKHEAAAETCARAGQTPYVDI